MEQGGVTRPIDQRINQPGRTILTQPTPKDLAPGAYWYVVPGKTPAICEKRAGEDYVRFTNGSFQRWVKPDE